MSKVYVVADTYQENFTLYTATANEELAKAVYNKLAEDNKHKPWFLADLKILEYTDEDALSLLNK